MIIVSQDKTVTTQSLDLGIDYTYKESGEFPDFKKEIVNFCIVDRKYNTILGDYKTEERAKEVLQEIYKFYEIAKRFECSSNNGVTIFTEPRFAYSMPEE